MIGRIVYPLGLSTSMARSQIKDVDQLGKLFSLMLANTTWTMISGAFMKKFSSFQTLRRMVVIMEERIRIVRVTR